MRRHPLPQDDYCNNFDEHRDENDDDADNHHRAVETNSGESNGDACYLSPPPHRDALAFGL